VTAPFFPGCVRIVATIADGSIVAASVACERPQGLGALFARHAPDQIPDLVGRLHALCAVSQSLASRAALAAAGASLDPVDLSAASHRLAAERLVELLRATAIGFADVVTPDPEEARALRQVLAAGGAFLAGSAAAADGAALAAGLDRLGVAALPPPGSWAARIASCAAEIMWSEAGPVDPLGPADDGAVIAALNQAGDAFATRPVLPGRRVQTGPVARSVLADRPIRVPLLARFAEIVQAARLLAGEGEPEAPWLSSAPVAPGIGFAAVESPRGRLHHLVSLDGKGGLARYLILAPTEWTFAPDGPFAAALTRLHPVATIPAERSIARLAALFDPCVACEIEVSHA